ncbi:hypothetical protein [Nonlabens sp.]|uniref:hypothetical protein n=1 Tax=Nonlabens sp. TaxID=1888209 RepID=UPI0025FB93CB|nr:hypothetical protein [Nonlabens sp.]
MNREKKDLFLLINKEWKIKKVEQKLIFEYQNQQFAFNDEINSFQFVEKKPFNLINNIPELIDKELEIYRDIRKNEKYAAPPVNHEYINLFLVQKCKNDSFKIFPVKWICCN